MYVCPPASAAPTLRHAAETGSQTRVVMAVNPGWLAVDTPPEDPLLAALTPVFALSRHDIGGTQVRPLLLRRLQRKVMTTKGHDHERT